MAVLVTGGTGFVGSRTARALCSKGEDVVLLDIRPAMNRVADLSRPAKVVVGTTRSVDDLICIIRDYKITSIIDTVIPAGRQPRPGPFNMVRDMAMGITNVLEAARLCSIKKVLLTSSYTVLGSQSSYGNKPVTEDETGHGKSTYEAIKILNERVARDYNMYFGMQNAVVRICAGYGPGPDMRGAFNINLIASYPALGRPVRLPLEPEGWFVPSHVDDIAEIFYRLLYAEKLEHVVFWGGGPAYTWGETANIVKEFIPDAQITFEGYPNIPEAREALETAHLIDWARTRKELGFEFRSLREGIKELIDLARAHPEMVPDVRCL